MAHGNDGARDEAQEAILMADKLAGSGIQNTCQHWAECGGGRLYEQIRAALGCTENDSTLQMIHKLAGSGEAVTVSDIRVPASAVIDALCLPGHPFKDAWEKLCLLCGRYCEPYLDGPRQAVWIAVTDRGAMLFDYDPRACGDDSLRVFRGQIDPGHGADMVLAYRRSPQEGSSATPEPHPDARELADRMREAAVYSGDLRESLRTLAEEVRRLQPQPAKVPAEVWLIGPKDADQFVSLGYTEQAAVEAWRGPYEFAELVPIHGAAEGEQPRGRTLALERTLANEREHSELLAAERDQALADLAAEREAHWETRKRLLDSIPTADQEIWRKAANEQTRRAAKAERIIEEDNERLLLAQREIDGLRERVAELEKREEEAEDYYDVAERVGELEYDITRCDECIYHPNSEARCFGKVNPGPPEPPRPKQGTGDSECDGSDCPSCKVCACLPVGIGSHQVCRIISTNMPGTCDRLDRWRASTTPCKTCGKRPRCLSGVYRCMTVGCSNIGGYLAAGWLAENKQEETP
jgi:hypothetical protein